MANSNGDDCFTNGLPVVEFEDWQFGLDFNDEEFLAGYPYSDISDSELEENCEFVSATSGEDDNYQSHDSYNNGFYSIDHESEQINNDSSEQEEMENDQKNDTDAYDMDSQEFVINELNIEEHHHDDHHQNLGVENGDGTED